MSRKPFGALTETPAVFCFCQKDDTISQEWRSAAAPAPGGCGRWLIVIAVATGISAAAAVALAAFLLRTQRLLRNARQRQAVLGRRAQALDAILATAPLTSYRWPATGDSSGAADAGFADFRAGLLGEDAERLESATRQLRDAGTPFTLTAAAAGGGCFAIEGRRAAHGDSVVWVADVSAAAAAERQRAVASAEAAGLREIVDALPLPVWRRSEARALVDCNAAYAAALDGTRETVLAEGLELIGNAGREPRASAASETARPHRFRRHVVIDGSRRLLEVTESPAGSGGTIGLALDRTDAEAAQNELARHVNAHAQVLESIQTGVAIYGADKRLKFFNAGFAELWGLEEDWLAGEPLLDEILERLRERRRLPEVMDFRAFRREWLDKFTSLIEPQQEMMHLPDDRTLRLSISPHPLGGLTFVYEDVTDRLALERSFNTLTEVQRATLDHLFEGIAVFGSDGRLKLHNPAYRSIWGLAEADLAGEPHIGEIVDKTRGYFGEDRDWPSHRQEIIARVTSHALSSGTVHRHDGSVLQAATVPLPDGNVLLTYLDVTDTARVERALRERNEALETADQLKSEFIANVSYELRTPLNAVIGFAEILSNQYFGDLNPRQLDYSHSILESANQLMTLINDILDLATIEAGYLMLEPAPVAIHEMLDEVFTLTRERARNLEIDLKFSCPPDIGTIEADRRRLKQALFNLISNALKFTPAGGTVTVEAKRTAQALELIVTDTGIGIPEADQARMFEKFERGAHQSSAGLGLSLVRSLIELHGGSVALESEPGRGTRVACRLPIDRSGDPVPTAAEPASPPV